MGIYRLRFWFEHGGFCIWGMNDKAKEKYGYPIKNDSLPISDGLVQELNSLEKEYATYLDWDYPPNPPLWSDEHKADFKDRATIVYEKLKDELGSEFQVDNEINRCV